MNSNVPEVTRTFDYLRGAPQAVQPLADPRVIFAPTLTGLCLLHGFGLPRRLRRN